MNSKNTKTSSKLKEEVRDELDKVNKDINQLQKRLTPGQVIDDAIYYPHGGNQQQMLQHFQANPIGTSFLTIGTLLLMEGETHQSYETIIKRDSGETLDSMKAKYRSRKEEIGNKVKQLKDKVSGKAHQVSNQVAGETQKVKKLSPLTYVALGAGLGVMTGAALPVSSKENEFLEEKVGNQMSSFSQELKDALSESANLYKNEFAGLIKDFDLKIFTSAS